MTKLCASKVACVIVVLCAATAVTSKAQVFNTLVGFDGINGGTPASMSLIQGADGNFYGTTLQGGIPGPGTIFKITSGGMLTTVYSFCSQANCVDGSYPEAGLVLATDGDFYGTTSYGGKSSYYLGYGTVFKVTPDGTLMTLHSFCPHAGFCNDGQLPFAGLVQTTDGIFYGTTTEGGTTHCDEGGCGTIFRITSTGDFETVHSFSPSGPADPFAGLIQAKDGSLYGTTSGGFSDFYGSVFKISPRGKLTTVHSFNGTDGAFPYGGLVQTSDGDFYGTTWGGGVNGNFGTVFKITPQGTLTTLYSFCAQTNCTDGSFPTAGLVQATDGNFYGTTSAGGIDLIDCTLNDGGCGTVFKITPAGTLTTLHSFDYTDGAMPLGGLFQGTGGVLYGSTYVGGPNTGGTIFSLNMGLGPFVAFVRPAGKVGETGGILGQGFTGTTSVSLNGTPANFTVVSDTFIRAKVPAGATTGYVTVATPSGTLTSNVPFHVIR